MKVNAAARPHGPSAARRYAKPPPLRTVLRLLLAAALVLAAAAHAQQAGDPAQVEVAEHPELGEHLVDAQGRTLYLFAEEAALEAEPDTVREGLREATPNCFSSCTAVWPRVRSDGAPQAGAGVDADLLYVEEVRGTQQAVYNGWPLYRFASDTRRGDALGQAITPPSNQAFGGAWYAVAPDGTPITTELEPPEDDAGEDGDGDGDGGDGGDGDDGDDDGGGYY